MRIPRVRRCGCCNVTEAYTSVSLVVPQAANNFSQEQENSEYLLEPRYMHIYMRDARIV